MKKNNLKTYLNYFIALVWIINGLFCKVINLVPRHQEIVSKILGNDYSFILIKIIGFLEIGMAIWVLSKFKPRFCTILQIIIVASMNILEFILVPELLLFGKINIIIATLFISILYANEFILTATKSIPENQ
ncbi:MAG: DoxX-like family protein [Flavobacterium sp.]